MRRKPQIHPLQQLPEVAGPTKRPPPTTSPESIQPFLKSGGRTFFLVDNEGLNNFDPREDGVQLITYVYIPIGYIGFLKELRVAPFVPPSLVDPWTSSGINPPADSSPGFRTFDTADVTSIPRATATNAVWTTPMGWESYFDNDDPAPRWRWHLRLIDDNIDKLRANRTNLAPFSVGDPASWYLVPDIPVPRSAYSSGIPGRAPGPLWADQRMQVLQGDKLSTHVMIPPNTTLALFAEWTQQLVTPFFEFNGDEGPSRQEYAQTIYPLLPSFGQLHGYLQAIGNAEAVNHNARYGWGG